MKKGKKGDSSKKKKGGGKKGDSSKKCCQYKKSKKWNSFDILTTLFRRVPFFPLSFRGDLR